MKKLIVLFCLLIIGCTATAYKLNHLEIGMTKNEALSIMGKEGVSRAATIDSLGNKIEVWEYELYNTKHDAEIGYETTYWLRFSNDRLTQWGQPGDWRKKEAQKYILEQKIESKEQIELKTGQDTTKSGK